MLSFILLPAIALLSGLVAATPLGKRVGPSGEVVIPAGGTVIPATTGYPSGVIHLVYKPVYIEKTKDCAYFECTAQTWFISATLTNNGNSYKLAERLSPPSPSSDANIDVYLNVPANVCGESRLVIDESQNYYDTTVNFQSAAPAITINCSPLP